ncbi:hypothetical protein HXX76_010330 [Chlamydomonas incerta]|uniref:Uncharacterized protein n=1 Tax=Chlamydomonas incerta TaxID=51695 RepID=A0A835SRU5_CHLIN|nr:hypothetical protein HXX76_010330 [Chlamydomonas incerta]|eukprot:KAG2430232.1 hypothetical protein HXX76_010330 [Chlamydomonas incerta]
MNLCFLRANGHSGYKCSRAMSARQCSENLDERAFTSYNQFFSNIHSLCLHVSNRNFERHTAQLLNNLAGGANATLAVLGQLEGGLRSQTQTQQALHKSLDQIRMEQLGLTAGLAEGLGQLGALQQAAAGLGQQMNRSLELEEELARRQGGLLAQLDSLEAAGQRHAAAAEAAWSALAEQAAALESRHADYAALTEALAASSSQLLHNSDQLAGAIEGVAAMQQHTRSLLRGMMGARWTLQDVAVYVAAGGLGALATSPLGLQAARPALLAVGAGVFAAEHLARVHLHAWLTDRTQVVPVLLRALLRADTAVWALRSLGAAAALLLVLRLALRRHRLQQQDRQALAALQQQMAAVAALQASMAAQQDLILCAVTSLAAAAGCSGAAHAAGAAKGYRPDAREPQDGWLTAGQLTVMGGAVPTPPPPPHRVRTARQDIAPAPQTTSRLCLLPLPACGPQPDTPKSVPSGAAPSPAATAMRHAAAVPTLIPSAAAAAGAGGVRLHGGAHPASGSPPAPGGAGAPAATAELQLPEVTGAAAVPRRGGGAKRRRELEQLQGAHAEVLNAPDGGRVTRARRGSNTTSVTSGLTR